MGLRDRLEKRAIRFGERALQTATVQAQRAGEGVRGFRAAFEDDEYESLSIERFLVNLVQVVRVEEQGERSMRDLYVKARKRRRKLGLVSFGAGPLAGVASQAADLYCETATVCDVVTQHGLDLSDEQIAAHLLVLWNITDDLDRAQGAVKGEPPIANILGEALAESSGIQQLPGTEELTTRSVVELLWEVRQLDLRGTVGDVRRSATSSPVRAVVFTGFRVKKVIKRAEIQLGVR